MKVSRTQRSGRALTLAALLHHFVSIPPPSSSHAHFVTRREFHSRSTIDSRCSNLRNFRRWQISLPPVCNFSRFHQHFAHFYVLFVTMCLILHYCAHFCVVEFFTNAWKFVVKLGIPRKVITVAEKKMLKTELTIYESLLLSFNRVARKDKWVEELISSKA